jgi:hypothetical protein
MIRYVMDAAELFKETRMRIGKRVYSKTRGMGRIVEIDLNHKLVRVRFRRGVKRWVVLRSSGRCL